MKITQVQWASLGRRYFGFLVAGLLLAGCATSKSGYQQADSTARRMADFRKQVQAIKVAVDEVAGTLAMLPGSPSTELRRTYRNFDRAVDRLEAADARARQRAERMRAQGREFFSAWEQEVQSIQNDELREVAQDRRVQLDAAFRSISRGIVALRDVFGPWTKDVRDLRTVLGRDLTVAGVDRAGDIIDQVRGDSADVQQALNSLVDQLAAVEMQLSSARK